MVRISVLLFLLIVGESELEVLPISNVNPSIVYKERHFMYVYNHIRQNIEGNYVNHKDDKGRETYAGISRRLHPNWYGWKYIDQAKPLVRHDSVPAAEIWALDFYLNLWIKGGFEKIEDRELALNLFDFTIHSSPRTVNTKVNRVLAKFGCNPVQMGGEWVNDDFNRVPSREFVLLLKIERIKLFNYLVTKDKSQLVFYRGWLNRLESI
jgi:lysozyme family protein